MGFGFICDCKAVTVEPALLARTRAWDHFSPEQACELRWCQKRFETRAFNLLFVGYFHAWTPCQTMPGNDPNEVIGQWACLVANGAASSALLGRSAWQQLLIVACSHDFMRPRPEATLQYMLKPSSTDIAADTCSSHGDPLCVAIRQ